MTPASAVSARPAGAAAQAAAAVVVSLAVYGAMWARALTFTGGAIDYPLDDVLIHLAMADGILDGRYGVTPGAPSAAASSILYPFLLAATGAGIWTPMAWNAAALALCAILWARLVAGAGLAGGAAGWTLVLAGPTCLGMAGAAFVGMEHGLQVAATLAVLVGLLESSERGRPSRLLIAAMILGPAVRYEALAASGLAALILIASGRWRWGVGLGLASLAAPALFGVFLMSQGLAPLPSSVLVKQAAAKGALDGGAAGKDFVAVMADRLSQVGANGPWVRAGAALLALAALAALVPAARGRRAAMALTLAGGAYAAHTLAGRIGAPYRYELYVVALIGGAAVAVLGAGGAARPRRTAFATLVAVAMIGAPYAVDTAVRMPEGTGNIFGQQRQMARFVRDYVKGPVAVNDLGWVAWRNPWPVLDLWGLGSAEAREARLGGAPRGWPEAMAREAGVELAMVYDEWVAPHLLEDTPWIKLGELRIDRRLATAGDDAVAFYATSPEAAADLRPKLKAFARTLPPHSHFVMAPQAPDSPAPRTPASPAAAPTTTPEAER